MRSELVRFEYRLARGDEDASGEAADLELLIAVAREAQVLKHVLGAQTRFWRESRVCRETERVTVRERETKRQREGEIEGEREI